MILNRFYRLLVLLLTTFPDCIREKDPDGNLPIHLLAYHHKGRMWINISEITGLRIHLLFTIQAVVSSLLFF